VITLPSGRKIGEGQPTFIIAEVGSNWRTFDDCKNSIAQAKKCGADAVKFQAYSADALYGSNPGGYLEYFNTVNQGSLPLEWLPGLAEKARACGIELMCSAFSPELVDAVDPHVNLHKVASAELTHKRILERLAKIGKPVVLSTGASGLQDVGGALQILGTTPVVLLHCVAGYPARETRLGRIKILADEFYRPVGYSDHSLSVDDIPIIATTLMKACVLEKHVNFVEADGPDAPHSLTADEFKTMVEAIRGTGTWGPGWTREEGGMIRRHNRRLIATRDLPAGTQLKEGENFGIYRSLKDDSHAFHAFAVDEINGKQTKRDIKAGQGIGPGDV